MVIPAARLPLPMSLRERVWEQFRPSAARSEAGTFAPEQLVLYLAHSKETDTSPLTTIRRRAARDARNEELAATDMATLAWVCEAFDEWQERYPLESPLREQVHRLLPLAVAMALVDESFFMVGAHPLHQLLDSLQGGAVGWQARLERAGQMLEQRIQRSVDKALEWFENRDQDINLITRELQAANDRDGARAERMVQRLAETENAQVRTLEARRLVAEEFNRLLSKHPLPAAIGEFVRGPWYDSAQLVMVKYGEDSAEWGDMRRTTRHLMESVQPRQEMTEIERERRDPLLRRLPAELRRWLLSLQHDSDATDSAIGLVEYAHLRMQHGQLLRLETIPAIAIEGEALDVATQTPASTVVGQWYRFQDEQGDLRVQLVLELSRGRHLVFANFVGLKALSLGLAEFRQRIGNGSGLPLPAECTFSASLAAAAGIDSDEALDRLLNSPGADLAPTADADIAVPTAPRAEDESPVDARSPKIGGKPVQPSEAPIIQDPGATGMDGEPRGASGFQSNAPAATTVAETPAMDDGEEAPELHFELDEGSLPPAADEPLIVESPAGAETQTAAPGSSPVPQTTTASEPQAAPAFGPQAAPVPEPQPVPELQTVPALEPASVLVPEAQAAPQPMPAPEPVLASETPQVATAPPSTAPAPAAATADPVSGGEGPPARRDIEVPMGAWLGFHDGEMPIMAKLAVYDPRRDNFIFVNRSGIALRELSSGELGALMDQGLVDILEMHSYFRDEVQRARGEGP